jgi:hypothetical protein
MTVRFVTTHFKGKAIAYPPGLPIPGDDDRTNLGAFSVTWPPHALPDYMGHTFPTLCRFWIILQRVNMIIDIKGAASVPLATAETEYQQLLAWARTIHPDMLRGDRNPSHVFFFQ